MPRILRYLRIAFSAACLIACVLLITLWVQSYSRTHVLMASDTQTTLNIFVERGVFGAAYSGLPRWSLLEIFTYGYAVTDKEKLPGYAGFYYGTHPVTRSCALLLIPIWFAVILVTAASVLPWLRWRFKLRTLLIATTLIAVVLGAIVYAVR